MSVSKDTIFAQPSMLAAINLCIASSGLEGKEIQLSLKIDAGHWTRIRNGEAHFPIDKLRELMDLCGNEAPLEWLANACGKGLVMLQSESERRLAEKEVENEMLRTRLAHFEDFIRIAK